MTNIKNIILTILLAAFFLGCKKNEKESLAKPENTSVNSDNRNERSFNSYVIDSSHFYYGAFSSHMLPPGNLQNLGYAMGGAPLVVSNNPEQISSQGWLFRNPNIPNSTSKMPLNGKFNMYLYHQNATSSDIYIHIIVSNPNAAGILLDGKGVVYTSSNFNGNGGRGFGPSYKVAESWMQGAFTQNFINKNISPYIPGHTAVNYYSVAVIKLSPSKTIDGRFEFDSHSSAGTENCFAYVIASTSSNPNTAFNLAQSNQHASGNFIQETPTTFGRECGIYDGSVWNGTTILNLPNRKGNVGLCLNTAQKGSASYSLLLQNQNASATGVINNSSSRSYGNYGCFYNFSLKFVNTESHSRNVTLFLVHTLYSQTSPGFTWHAPIKVGSNPILETYLTFSYNKQQIANITIPASSNSLLENINFYVPGLISSNMELVVETN